MGRFYSHSPSEESQAAESSGTCPRTQSLSSRAGKELLLCFLSVPACCLLPPCPAFSCPSSLPRPCPPCPAWSSSLGKQKTKCCPGGLSPELALQWEGPGIAHIRTRFPLCEEPPPHPTPHRFPTLPSSSPMLWGAQPGQNKTPALGPRSRNGVQFHHKVTETHRKYKLLLNFYYYYFYPLGSHVSPKLVLIKLTALQPTPCCGSHGGLVHAQPP